MTKIEENIIEIAWIDHKLYEEDVYDDDVNTDFRKNEIIYLAEKFENENAIDWDESDRDYYEEIEAFATKYLTETFKKVEKGGTNEN